MRIVKHIAFGVAAMGALAVLAAPSAEAQFYKGKNITMLVPVPGGSGLDLMARTVARRTRPARTELRVEQGERSSASALACRGSSRSNPNAAGRGRETEYWAAELPGRPPTQRLRPQ